MTEQKYETLAELATHQNETVAFLPHGPVGGWQRFITAAGEQVEQWDMDACLLALSGYMLQKADFPVVISTLYSNIVDEAPSYKIIIYDLTQTDFITFDQICQPSWFSVQVSQSEGKFHLKLSPTRSLIKLLYKTIQ